MSISDLEMKWINFAKSLRSVGALLIFVMIPYVAFVIIPIQFILTMVAIGNINKLNHELNDPYLTSFRSKYLTASIFKLIGSLIIHVGGVMMAFVQVFGAMMYPFYFPRLFFPPTIIFLIIGFVIMIIGSGIEVGAWDNLKLFIHYNNDLFPERTRYDTTISVENLRSGALLWALGFLIIPILIGWIYQLVGYFGLSKVAEGRMKIEPIIPVTQDFQPISPPPQEPQPVDGIKFCPMCGASVTKGASFCGECGVKFIN